MTDEELIKRLDEIRGKGVAIFTLASGSSVSFFPHGVELRLAGPKRKGKDEEEEKPKESPLDLISNPDADVLNPPE